jgi:hypothetical protein
LSLHLVVFLSLGAELPGANEWSEEAERQGFRLKVPLTFDPVQQSGGLLVVCDELEGCFEFYNDSISDYLEEVGEDFSWWTRLRLRRYERVVDFVTHSSEDDWRSAVVASAAFAAAAKGTLLDCQTGRFVRSGDAPAWARSQTHDIPPGLPARRARIRASVHEYVATVLKELAYAPCAAPRDMSSPADRWYSRPGARFTHELARISVDFDGDRSFLGASFLGATEPLELILSSGVIGRAAGRDLFHYYVLVLGRPVESVLPRSIPVAEGFPDSGEAARLRAEIHEIHPGIFEDLWRRGQR